MGLTQTTATRGTHINQPLCLRWAISHLRVPFKWKQKRPKTARAASQAAGAISLTTSAPSLASPVGSSLWSKSSKSITPRARGLARRQRPRLHIPSQGDGGDRAPQTLSGPADQVSLQPSELRLPTRDLAGFPPNPLTSMFH